MADNRSQVVLEFKANNYASSGIKSFSQDIDRVLSKTNSMAAEINSSMSAVQQRVAAGFKFASFDTSSLNKMQEQFQTAGDLQSRLFAATHTGLQVALNNHDDYFAQLRVKWQSNESMLTLISKLETAERKKILADYGKTTNSTLSSLRSAMRLGFATYIIRSFMDTGTSMLEAKRKGESMFDAFLSGLPIINRLADSAKKLAYELSGLAAVEEATGKSAAVTDKYNKLFETLSRQNKLQKAGGLADILQAQFDYDDRLKEIDVIDKEAESIRKFNKEIDETIKKGKVVSAGFGGVTAYSVHSKNEIAELESKKLTLQNFDALRQKAQQEYLLKMNDQMISLPSASGLSISLPKGLFDNTEGAAAAAEMADEEMKKVIASTRDAMQQMRSMDYLTRMERIENLRAYQAANANALDTVLEANEVVNQEIQNLERSRVDAMKVYQAELREDMQDSALYTSKKWAEAARAIEGSMSSAFQSMITQGASFSEAMQGFLNDIVASMSKMYSDMAARGLMNMFMGSAGSIGSGGGGGGFVPVTSEVGSMHSGGIAGVSNVPKRIVPNSLFANAPRLHTGTNEYPAILKRKEGVFTEEQMEHLGPAGGGESNTYNFYVSAIDAQGVAQFLKKYSREMAATNKQAKNNNYSRR